MADEAITLSPPTLDPAAPSSAAPTSSNDINITAVPPSGAPLTEREVAAQLMGRRGPLLTGIRSFAERNIQTGIPLDETTGAPVSQRLALDFRREPDQKAYLEHVYGTGNVRKADTGDWIVRSLNPKTGTLTDYTVDPTSLDKGDLAGLVPMARELAEYYVGGKLLRAIPHIGEAKGLIGALRDVIGGSAAIQASGAASDVGIRAVEGRPVDFGEILRSRTVRGAIDVGLGGAAVTANSFVRFLRNPFLGSRAQVQVDGAAARDALADKYGVYIELTPGELTGSPTLSRKESYMEKVPGSSPVYQKFLENRDTTMQSLQRLMLGTDVPPEDVLGDRAIRALQASVAPTERALAAAKGELAASAVEQVGKAVAGSTVAEGQFTKTYVGDAIRNRITALRDQAKASANALYDRVRSLGGDKPIFNADQLAADARKMLDGLPPQFKQGAEGDVLRSPSTAFASETHILSKLRELSSAEGQSYTLTDLQRMRREVYDDMLKGEAVPGLSTHYLSEIGGMLTGAIERGVETLPGGELKSALQTANGFYRNEVLPFEQKGIAEIFNPISEKAHVGPAELASRLTTGPGGTDKFNVLKGLLGNDSVEIGLLKRQMADDVVGGAMKPGENLLDAKSLLSRLDNFRRTNPDMYGEVFGKSGDAIAREAKLLNVIEGDTVPADVVEGLLKEPTPTVGKLKAAIDAQRNLNVAYRNRILEGTRTGKFDASAINPADFVNRFVASASVPEIKDVFARLAGRPALVEDIRSSYLQDLFRDARTARNKSIGQALEDASRSAKARAILGDDMFNDIQKLSSVQETMIAKRMKGESAGAFAAGGRIDEALVHPLRFTSQYVREFVSARVINSPALRRMVTQIPPSEPSKMYMILSSPPFVRGVVDEFGDSSAGIRTARAFMSSLKLGLDQFAGSFFEPRQAPMAGGVFQQSPSQRARAGQSGSFYLPPPTLNPTP